MSEPANATSPKPDTITNLFGERDRPPLQEDVSSETRKKQATSPLSSSQPQIKTETEAAKADDPGIVPSDHQTLQEELEKSRKTILENQQYGRQNARKLKNALKQTKALLENGTLSEEEAMSLMASLENDSEEEVESHPYDAHPFGKVLKVANTELANLRKYSDDALLDDKIKAFDYFLNMAPSEEIKEALEELNDLIDDPIKLTKKMLSIGKAHYDESYKDIADAGGFQGYMAKKREEIEKLNKSIDRLTKKLAQYEDYDQPGYRIKEMGESSSSSAKRNAADELFDTRDSVGRK